MPRHQEPKKGAVHCEKPRRVVCRRESRGYPNGETRWAEGPAALGEHISQRGERGELKHLSTRRRREYSLSSGERKGRSPNPDCGTDCGRCNVGVVGAIARRRSVSME